MLIYLSFYEAKIYSTLVLQIYSFLIAPYQYCIKSDDPKIFFLEIKTKSDFITVH